MNKFDQLDIKEGLREKEGEAISQLAIKARKLGMRAVEVGSWKGMSTYYLARSIKGYGLVSAVDHWEGTKGTHDEEVAEKDIYEIFIENIKQLEIDDIVNPIKKESLVASQLFVDQSVDFIFIDADHRYEPFMADLKAWWPKLKVGGIMCGHDFDEFYYSSLNERQKKLVDDNLESDITPKLFNWWKQRRMSHIGVMRGLYDFFQDKHNWIKGTRIWWIQKDDAT